MSETFIRIPDKVLQMDITPSSKLLYGEILRLSNSEVCFAHNEYFMQKLKVNTKKTISNCLKELEENNCISIEIVNKNKRYITPLIMSSICLTSKSELTEEQKKLLDKALNL